MVQSILRVGVKWTWGLGMRRGKMVWRDEVVESLGWSRVEGPHWTVAPVARMEERMLSILGVWPSEILGRTKRMWGCL